MKAKSNKIRYYQDRCEGTQLFIPSLLMPRSKELREREREMLTKNPKEKEKDALLEKNFLTTPTRVDFQTDDGRVEFPCID